MGIEQCATSDVSSQSAQVLLQAEKARTEQFALEVVMLEARACKLEQLMVLTHDLLLLPVEEIVQNATTVLHGPDILAQFDSFLFADELRTSVPDLLSLVNCLIDSKHNAASSSEVTGKQRKVVKSLCTLLNAQSH